jgi:hypothetical protein
MNKIIKLLLLAITVLLTGCSGIRGYERVYLNDAEMALKMRKIQRLEKGFHVYREGASGASGGKSGGGCGCN